MSDKQMLSHHIPKKLYNAMVDEEGESLNTEVLDSLPEGAELPGIVGEWKGDYDVGMASIKFTTLTEAVEKLATQMWGAIAGGGSYPDPEKAAEASMTEVIGKYGHQDSDIATDLATVYGALRQQNVMNKLAAVASGEDDLPEKLAKKHLISPMINDSNAKCATYAAAIDDIAKVLTITARQPGELDPNYYYELVYDAIEAEYDVDWDGIALTITIDNSEGVNYDTRHGTAYGLIAWIQENQPEIFDTFIMTTNQSPSEPAEASKKLTPTMGAEYFVNGVNGHALVANATEIDAAIDWHKAYGHHNKYDATGAPGVNDDVTQGYAIGSLWYDAVAQDWYRCVDATEGAAVWSNTTLELGELGSAATATIVNDLTTGGETDALSAEMGKNLAEVIGTYEGEEDIATDLATLYGDVKDAETGLLVRVDALESVTPSSVDGLPLATAASNVLTIADEPAEGATVTVGDVLYLFRRDALTEDGVAAQETITISGLPTAGDTVTIGSGAAEKVYKFVAACADANDVLIGDDAEACVNNLVAAITDNGTEGTQYGTGTTAHTQVTAAKVTATSLVVEAQSPGFFGNYIVIAENAANVELTGGTGYLTGGIDPAETNHVYTGGSKANAITNLIHAITFDGGEGTNEGTQYWGVEEPNSLATAEASVSDDIVVTALVKGAAGNLIAAEVDGDTDISWSVAGDVLSGGVDGVVGAAHKVLVDSDAIYMAMSECTTAASDWVRIPYVHTNMTPVTSVDLEAATPYVVLDTDQTIVVTATDGTGDAITLPAATGSQRKLTISVQAATNAVTVNVAGDPDTDTINTADSLSVPALTTVTLLDYATGKWMTL